MANLPAARFEDLWVWQEARMLTKSLYLDVGLGSPAFADRSFRNQLRRASVSIMNNIAEGFERGSDAEFAKFLGYSKGSCGEVRSMMYIAEDLNYLSPQTAEQRRAQSRKISSGLHKLINHLKP